jgi:hypothetical protein
MLKILFYQIINSQQTPPPISLQRFYFTIAAKQPQSTMSLLHSARKTGRGQYQHWRNNVNSINDFPIEAAGGPSRQPPSLVQSNDYYFAADNRSRTFNIGDGVPLVDQQSGYTLNRTPFSPAFFPNNREVPDLYDVYSYQTAGNVRYQERSAFAENEIWQPQMPDFPILPYGSRFGDNFMPQMANLTEEFCDSLSSASPYADNTQFHQPINQPAASTQVANSVLNELLEFGGLPSSRDRPTFDRRLIPSHESLSTARGPRIVLPLFLDNQVEVLPTLNPATLRQRIFQ